MTIKRFLFVTLVWTGFLPCVAQPRPFEVDDSFVPELDYIQKIWTGRYDGIEQNSQIILSVSRVLRLDKDLTYTDVSGFHINQDTTEILLKYESGTYAYSKTDRLVTYSVKEDSAIDVNSFLQSGTLSYRTNHYTEQDSIQERTDNVQFTYANNDADRQWVFFDEQLMSSVDPRQKAVYSMTGTALDATVIEQNTQDCIKKNEVIFDLWGRRASFPNKGLYIKNGKKMILK